MKFETYIPCDILKPFVASMAVQESEAATIYKVLPDTGLVLGFQYKGRLARIDNDTEAQLSISGVSGLASHSRTFKNSPDIGTVLIFFKETGAVPFFKEPLHELFGESVSLDNFMFRSELLCLEEQLVNAKSDALRITAVEKFLISRMTNPEPDKLVLAALALIHRSKGNIKVRELMEQLHISQSPLEKRFRRAVGASPKRLASIVRLKHVIQQYNAASSFTELGYEAGFYDQAHFIKAFKTFTGDTPDDFFADNK